MRNWPGIFRDIPDNPIVKKLDVENKTCRVESADVNYYTDAIVKTDIKVLSVDSRLSFGDAELSLGDVLVRTEATKYKKIKFHSHENIGYGPVDLPDQELQTTAVWWQLEQSILDAAFASRQDALDGFLAAAYALHTTATVSVMAEGRDLRKAVGSGDAAYFASRDQNGRGQWRDAQARVVDPERQRQFTPTLFLYDNYPGGIGQSEPLYAMAPRLVRDALALVAACDCRAGCPACVGPVLAADESRERSARQTAMTVLQLLQ